MNSYKLLGVIPYEQPDPKEEKCMYCGAPCYNAFCDNYCKAGFKSEN